MKLLAYATAMAIGLATVAVPAQASIISITAVDDTTSRDYQFVAPGDLAAGDQFGYSIAVSGNTMVVGSRYAKVDIPPLGPSSVAVQSKKVGAAYVYVKDGDAWTQQAKLVPSNPGYGNPTNGKRFGQAVAIDGDTIVVGAPYEDIPGSPVVDSVGAAYVFTRSGTNWTQQDKLTIPEVSPGVASQSATSSCARASGAPGGLNNGVSGIAFLNSARFGAAVAISGDSVVVGAYGAYVIDGESSAGAAYTYERSSGTWSHTQSITDDPPVAFNQFGQSVAINGDRLLIGSPGKAETPGSSPSYTGKISSYSKACGRWFKDADFTPSGIPGKGRFGASIQMTADQAIVAAQGPSVTDFPDYPALFKLKYSGSAWEQDGDPLTGKDPGPLAAFTGTAVAFGGTPLGSDIFVGNGDLMTGGGATYYGPEKPLSTDINTPLEVKGPGVLLNDFDPDIPLFGMGELKAVNASDPAHGSVTLNEDGGFLYTPDKNFVGEDTFTYQAEFTPVVSDPATVTIKVTGEVPPPPPPPPGPDNKKPQSLPADGAPKQVKKRGITVINKRGATTAEGQPMSAKVKWTGLATRGDLRCVKVNYGKRRAVSVQLSGTCKVELKVTYTAPGTAKLKAFKKVKTYRP